jgi:HEAT repeat protein
LETLETACETELLQLVEQLADKDWRRVAEAEQKVLAAGEAGMQVVIAGMMHTDSRVRRACAGFMDHHGDDRCLLSLTERLLSDSVPNVRRMAVHSLGCDRCKASPLTADRVPLLMSVIQNDPNKWVRYEAIWALNTSKNDDRFLPPLRQLMETETDRDLRKAAHTMLYHRDREYRAAHIARLRARQNAPAT